ncbi:retinol-binding protein pinta-like isoform X1 [Tenebrio molitor]|uniref:retinol-binding protein pinta-like isoform X1 n=2 Tax=Tenebrio molitor TaxID=7067 RepID=UPI00362479C9
MSIFCLAFSTLHLFKSRKFRILAPLQPTLMKLRTKEVQHSMYPLFPVNMYQDVFYGMELVREKVYKKFNKTQESVSEDVQIVRKWLQTQPHLPEIMSDIAINKFLMLNKFSIEKTKQKIDMYYTIRSLLPDMYDQCNPKLPCMKAAIDSCYCFLHPVVLEESNRVCMFKLKKPNTGTPREIIMLGVNFTELRLAEDYAMYDVWIFDLATCSLNDSLKMTPSIIVKTLAIYEKVFSLRAKALYLLNTPSYISNILAFLKTLVKPKQFNRIHIHKDAEVLKEIFTEDILPKDYGGSGPSLEQLNGLMKVKLEQFQDRFDQLDQMRVDESLRPEKLVNSDILGFYGNFKKLNVD